MSRYVAFLRGVSPQNLSMAALRQCLEASGYAEVRTVLSSGNVAFSTRTNSVAALERRVAAAIAITCYENLTPAEELNKYNEWFVGKGGIEFRERGAGRPTKKDRREIDGFKDDWFDVEFDDES